MKCIQMIYNNGLGKVSLGEVVRVSNKDAEDAVRANKAIYVPKSEWKKQREVKND